MREFSKLRFPRPIYCGTARKHLDSSGLRYGLPNDYVGGRASDFRQLFQKENEIYLIQYMKLTASVFRGTF